MYHVSTSLILSLLQGVVQTVVGAVLADLHSTPAGFAVDPVNTIQMRIKDSVAALSQARTSSGLCLHSELSGCMLAGGGGGVLGGREEGLQQKTTINSIKPPVERLSSHIYSH